MNTENQNDVISDLGVVNEETLSLVKAGIVSYEAAGGVAQIALNNLAFDSSHEEWRAKLISSYLSETKQTVLKRSNKWVRQANITRKRIISEGTEGIRERPKNQNEHGSRAIRRKVLHDARKGTKPGLFGRGSVKLTGLTDADLVERHGRPALAVMSEERFQAALGELWDGGRRLDLKPKTDFQKTVEALSEVMGRRIA